MCGRSGLYRNTLLIFRGLNKETLRCACSYRSTKSSTGNGYTKPDWLEEYNDGKHYVPSYNIAPTNVTPVLVSGKRFLPNSDGKERCLKPMMWGIIPPWHKEDYRKHGLSTNNCRLEGLKNSKLYAPALNNGGRCIVVVEGFYEWQTTDKTTKNRQPYYIYAPQANNLEVDNKDTWPNTFSEEKDWDGIKLLHLAAIYSVWKHNNTVMYCYSIITMESNTTFDWLHHRMPAVLDNEDQIQAWLDIDNVNPDMALSYLTPIKILSWHPVSNAVNNSRNNQDNLHKRITLASKEKRSQKLLTTFFTKAEKRKSSNEEENKNKKCKTYNFQVMFCYNILWYLT